MAVMKQFGIRKGKQNHQWLYAYAGEEQVDFDTQDIVLNLTSANNNHVQSPYYWYQGKVEQGQGELSTAANSLSLKQDTILVLPASQGLLTQVKMPSTKSSHIRNALPFALASQVLGDVGSMHLAWQRCHDKKYVQVAGYDKQKLDDLLFACSAKGLRITQVVLDAQLLPQNNVQWTLLADHQQWLLSYGHNQCCSIQSYMRLPLLQQLWTTLEPAADTKINIVGPQAAEAKAILEATSFANVELITPAMLLSSLPSAIDESSLAALSFFYQPQQAICLLPKQTMGAKLQQLWHKVDQRLVQWTVFCLFIITVLLFVHNDNLQQQLKRLQMSESQLQTAISQELSRLSVPHNMAQRIDDIQRMPQTEDASLYLLHTWAMLNDAITATNSPITLEQMAYSNYKLRLVWSVDSEQSAAQQQTTINESRAVIDSNITIKSVLSPFRDQRAQTSYGQHILTLHWQGGKS